MEDPGPNVSFSDSRFLRRIVLEAQTAGAVDEVALQRLECMGFSEEVARVALHAAGGDEGRATRLCMSGLAFVDGGQAP
eukprot:CAMPEP_0179313038 /NCGR_PEP_ID=MMETSP0797-20121207/53597_1 /TAXON_ID=47934 /ORGANISM="Dinophysis acuminata, Strain DAEP01" /LENGTH=78 /DNA_ID=CAMNT_0021023033 /DNA_START=35 /DNA_END=268 /DNA_ORIENTATION=-